MGPGTLGLTQADALELRDAILQALAASEATPGREDEYGKRYLVDFEMSRAGRVATIRTAWIVRVGESVPRLTI